MSTTFLGYLFTILSAAAFASTSLFLKIGLDLGMTAWSFTLLHSLFSVALVAAIYRRGGGSPLVHRRPPVRLIGAFVIAGASAAIAFNVALAHLSISLGTILLFTYPALVALGAWLVLGQRPTRLHLAALALTLAGAVLTVNFQELASGATSMLGVVLALFAALAHAMYLVWSELTAEGMSATESTGLTRLAMMVGVLLIHPQVVGQLPSLPWQAWALCALAAGLAGVLPFFFLNRGIALIGANRAAIASVAELPVALALGMLFAGDAISPVQWAGAALITVAVIVSQMQPAKGEETPDGSGTGTA